ncbi:collagenase [Kitasatospora viridis]|uniref:microbial collagenase n=1 Tax=Kitasatospora viridis TaxID=281105 RepID=A0A561UN07_9ACTN|nr:collagenase [Kitasatospora viridis]TWG00740.1 collagenase [Kitasatospora viridis]
MRQPFRLPKIMAVLAAASTAVAGFAATPSFAAAPTATTAHQVSPARPSTAIPPTGSALGANTNAATQNQRLAPALLPPHSPQSAAPKAPAPRLAARAGAATRAATSCTPADFSGRTGADLVSYIEGSTQDCISSLFPLTGSDATAVFKESQMTAVANGLQAAAASYAGDNSTGIFQLAYFLQAGYYVQYNNPTDVPAYSAALTSAVQAALDTLVASPHFLDDSDGNGQVAGEAMILSDSANLQAHYLNTYKQVLNAYTSAWDSSWYMVNFANSVFTPIFRGHQNPDYVAAVTADPSIINTLDSFAQNHLSMLGGTNGFLDSNAALETSRFIEHPALAPTVKPLIQALLNQTQISGPTAAVWVPLAGMANYYDPNNCSYYGTCDLPTRLKAAALPISYTCDSTHSILAQSLTAADLTAVCTSLENEDGFVHNLVKDNGPIPGQYENTLQMVVFASPQDYQTYAGGIYGVSTNNGGITLIGDPTDPNNQPISLTYQNGNDGFTAGIWNLNHEYTHALDGRLDLKGNFTQQTAVPDVWWIEGVAEYVSYTYRNVTDTGAVAEAPKHTYALSTLFQNTYENSDTTRTYPWGYLAVRYMVEKHPDVIQNMLSHFRTGDYTGGYAVYNSIGTAYDADFNTWLDACAAGACVVGGAPTAAFTAAPTDLAVQFTDQSTETGGSISSWAWNFGDGATATTQNPSHTYAAAGSYTVGLTVTDANGKTATISQSVTVSSSGGTGGGVTPCTSSNTQQLDRNCERTGQSATAGNLDYYWIYLPAGTTTLSINSSGGTGTAYLFYNADTWATPSANSGGSQNNGTTQSLTVTNSTAGYRYISLYAQTDFSGVTISTQY